MVRQYHDCDKDTGDTGYNCSTGLQFFSYLTGEAFSGKPPLTCHDTSVSTVQKKIRSVVHVSFLLIDAFQTNLALFH